MNQLLAGQIEEAVDSQRGGLCVGLGCEAQLRAAAATVSDAPPGVITATTVVCVLGQDDATVVESMVADIADEFGLEARMHMHVGSFSVRFSRIDQSER